MQSFDFLPDDAANTINLDSEVPTSYNSSRKESYISPPPLPSTPPPTVITTQKQQPKPQQSLPEKTQVAEYVYLHLILNFLFIPRIYCCTFM